MEHIDPIAQLTQQVATAIGLLVAALATAGVGLIAAFASVWIGRIKAKALEAKLDINTNETIKTRQDVQEVKSDVKDVGSNALTAVSEADKAKVIARMAESQNRQMVTEVLKRVDKTAEAVNGRTTELVEAERKASRAEGVLEGAQIHDGVVNRISALEEKHDALLKGHEILTQGQVELKRAVDKMTESVNGVASEVRKQSKF